MEEKENILTNEVYHCGFRSAFANGYGNKVKDKEDFIRRFDDITTAIKKLPYVCGFCYTQVSDVQQEINGLLTPDRDFKIEPGIIKEINEKRVR